VWGFPCWCGCKLFWEDDSQVYRCQNPGCVLHDKPFVEGDEADGHIGDPDDVARAFQKRYSPEDQDQILPPVDDCFKRFHERIQTSRV